MTEAFKSKGCGAFVLNCLKFLFCGLVLMAAIETSSFAQPISTDSPACFFNNAADRLLKAYTAQWAVSYFTNNAGALLTMNNPGFVATFNVTNAFGVSDIPVWVSNRFVYTPAVHRLLQLAANMYDATTTNRYPDIFRPVFSGTENGLGTNVFIIGYTNQPSHQLHQSGQPDGSGRERWHAGSARRGHRPAAGHEHSGQRLWRAVDHWREKGISELQRLFG